MKIRTGFVSNSSSSSFIIEKKYLAPIYQDILRDLTLMPAEIENSDLACEWDVYERDDEFECRTVIDNFDMEKFVVEYCKVDPRHLKFN